MLLRAESDQPKRNLLPNARDALRGWIKKIPPTVRDPVPEEVILAVAARVMQKDVLAAAALALQLDTYTWAS